MTARRLPVVGPYRVTCYRDPEHPDRCDVLPGTYTLRLASTFAAREIAKGAERVTIHDSRDGHERRRIERWGACWGLRSAVVVSDVP